jgi:hypothetical protein
MKIDMNQSLKHLIYQKYGRTGGRQLVRCIQDCLVKHDKPADIKKCINDCLKKKVAAGKITEKEADVDVDVIVDRMDNYETIGR